MVARRLLLLAASAAVLAQGPPPPPEATKCTSLSFTIPSWLIKNITSNTAGTVSFGLVNRASNYTAELSCPSGGSGWTACAVQGKADASLQVSVQTSASSLQFAVNQTWTCSDRASPVTFIAVGKNSAALGYKLPLLIKASLLSPVALTPAYLPGPTGHDTKGCSAKSEKPTWVVSSVNFQDQKANGPGSPAFQSFDLLMTNEANGYQVGCMAGTSFDDSPDLSALYCAGNEFQSSAIGAYPIATTGSFDPATGAFTVNQTWFCDDADPAAPLSITATGTAVVPLTCVDKSPHDSSDAVRRVCSLATPAVTVAGKVSTSSPLPPYSIDQPLPSGDGCTVSSIFHPQWQFSGFSIANSSVTFDVILQASAGFQFPLPVYQGAKVAGSADSWYDCDLAADGHLGPALFPYRCTLKFEPAAHTLTLKADWACDDLDPAHPVLFSGVTTTTIANTTDPAFTWTAPIANVTWKSS